MMLYSETLSVKLFFLFLILCATFSSCLYLFSLGFLLYQTKRCNQTNHYGVNNKAAWYPDRPTKDDQTSMQQLIHAIAKFYPCTYCAHDFQQNLQQTPVVTTTRQELCMWLCEQHNRVNEKLGKETFPCTVQQLDQRWRKSDDPKCTGSSSSSSH
jgi:mitochondrial FAD-linked sulfhydryl oxidase